MLPFCFGDILKHSRFSNNKRPPEERGYVRSKVGIDIVLACLYCGATDETEYKLSRYFGGYSTDQIIKKYVDIQNLMLKGLSTTSIHFSTWDTPNEMFVDKVRNLVSIKKDSKDDCITIINLIHLEGSWLHPFNRNNTEHKRFGIYVVPVMIGRFQTEYYGCLKYAALKLYFENGGYMLFVLPRFKRSGLDDDEVLEVSRRANKCIVNMQIPILNLVYDYDIKEEMEKYGKTYGGILDNGYASISSFKQHISITINESGVDMTSQTTCTMTRSFSRKKKIKEVNFIIEDPFYYYVIMQEVVILSGYYC